MEMQYYFSYLAVLLIIIPFLFAFVMFKKPISIINSTSNLPPGPKKLPFIGNLHLLYGKLPHHCLRDLANIYGPIMHLQLGEISTVVVSSPEVAREIFQNHDVNFSDRPLLHSFKTITYGFSDIVFARHGDQWRELRKICNAEFFSQKRMESFRSIRDAEHSSFVRTIAFSSTTSSPINVRKILFSVSFNIITRAALGKEFKRKDAFLIHLKKMISLIAGFSAVDVFPSFKFFQLMNVMSPKMRKLHREVDEILECTIQEHRVDMETERVDNVEDILSVLLRLQDKAGNLNKVSLTDTVIKAVILDLFLAGAESSVIATEWAMFEMVREPRVMEKAAAEVRRVFANSEGKIDETKLHELTYLNFIIKETLRLHPPGPLLTPREAKEKCKISGYDIPAKTRLLVNAWAIGRDANHWKDPEKFYPERFSEKEVKYGGVVDYELIPFGVGRRSCPGGSFGLQSVVLTLSNLLFHFDWKLPDGQNSQNLDTTEVFYTASQRKNELFLIPFLRDVSHI